ncbi:hypothetical protein ABT390_38895, partial [Streptomyces aurantiacus]|uniref:hypothetical protein n=1 Tax=Streptomyces aurantiacus TaxID=47760 RepID=UPI00331D0B4A
MTDAPEPRTDRQGSTSHTAQNRTRQPVFQQCTPHHPHPPAPPAPAPHAPRTHPPDTPAPTPEPAPPHPAAPAEVPAVRGVADQRGPDAHR